MGGILIAVLQLRSPLLMAAVKTAFDRLGSVLKNLKVLEYKFSYANFYLLFIIIIYYLYMEKSALFQVFSESLFTCKHWCI